MTDKKLVSVLICTHNAENFISATLKSIFNQTYPCIEILIHDDASKDMTLEVINKVKEHSPFPIKIFSNKKTRGPYKGLNFLLSKATGEYIAIMDHDDLWRNDKTELQIKFLDSHPEFQACGSMTYVLWEKYNKLSLFQISELSQKTYHNTLVYKNNKSFRYREDFLYRNDFYFMKNSLCKEGRHIYNIQTPLAVWRIRADGKNLSKRWAGFNSILRYFCATHDLKGSLLALFFNALPDRAKHYILLFRHARINNSCSKEQLEKFM